MADGGYNPETDEAHRDDTQSMLNGIKKIGTTTVTVLSTLLGAVGVPAVAIGVIALAAGVILFNAIELDFVTSHPYATSETYAYHMMEDMNRETMYAGRVISGNAVDNLDEPITMFNGWTGQELLSDPYWDGDKLAEWNGFKNYKNGKKATQLVGDTGEAQIWNFFADKGLTEAGIAGLMGNLRAESGCSSINLQNTSNKKLGMTDEEYTNAVDNGSYTNFVNDSAGYGIAQWTSAGRKQGLLSYAQSQGKSIGDLGVQLEYLWHELETSYSGTLTVLQGTNDLTEASTKVLQDFERPKARYETATINTRAGLSQDVYTALNGTTYSGGGGEGGTETVEAEAEDPNKVEDPTLVGVWSKYLEDFKDIGVQFKEGERQADSKGIWKVKDPALQLLDHTSSIAAQQDMIDITKFAAKYNNKMFEIGDIYYEYKQWFLNSFKKNGNTLWEWKVKFPVKGTTGVNGDDDGLYEHLQREHIEGEEELDANGIPRKKFMLWWQEVQGLYYILSAGNGNAKKRNGWNLAKIKSGWGNTGDEYQYKFEKDSERYDDPLDTDGYFVNNRSLSEIEGLLAYQFDYYYDAVAVTSRRNPSNPFKYESTEEHPGLENGDYYPIAYRYKRLPDPDPLGPFYTMPNVSPAPYTRFVMESAPNTISNSYTIYKYIYVPVSELQGVEAEEGTFDYTPDPDKYEPPQGYYCIGRYKIVNPGPFIDALSNMEPYFKSKYSAGWDMYGYRWATDQMREFTEWLEQLPILKPCNDYYQSRIQMYTELAEMYEAKKIDITYEGVLYEGIYGDAEMEKFVEDYKKVLPDKYSSWHYPTVAQIKKKSGKKIHKKFLDPDAHPSSYPFWSYGVTYWNNKDLGEQAIVITDQEYDKISSWLVTYEDQLEGEEGIGEYPFGEGSLEDFYNYYINQGDYPTLYRGDSNSTVQSSGCLDCSVAMIASFWKGQQVNVSEVSNYVGSSGALDTPSALAHFGLKQSGNIYGNFAQGVASEIDAGRPVIVHVRYNWRSVDDPSIEYHHSGNGHFLTAYGYNDEGIIVADPGRRANHVIPYKDWDNAAVHNDLYYRTVTPIGG